MFDVGASELLLVVIVAIVVIGPKDLPLALKAIGAWVGRARSLAREFQKCITELSSRYLVEMAESFICQQNVRFDCKGTRDGYALAHPPGQFVRISIRELA